MTKYSIVFSLFFLKSLWRFKFQLCPVTSLNARFFYLKGRFPYNWFYRYSAKSSGAFCAVATFDFHRIFLSRNAPYTHRENTNNGNLFSWLWLVVNTVSHKESKSRSRKSRTSSTFFVSQKAVQPNQKSLVQRYFNHSTHALTKSSWAFCAIAIKSVVWKPTLSRLIPKSLYKKYKEII